VTSLGITGHQSLPRAAYDSIAAALDEQIEAASRDGVLWGVGCLAVGADQLFADLVLRSGGRLHAVIPAEGYEQTFDAAGLRRYRTLVGAAAKIDRLGFAAPTERSFLAAGRRVVRSCDRLLAVWDGRPAQGLGGTADIVMYARTVGRPVEVIWPLS
jgi:hypothetical protein